MSMHTKKITGKQIVLLGLINNLKTNLLNSRIGLEKYMNTGNKAYLHTIKNLKEENLQLISSIGNRSIENIGLIEEIRTSLISYNNFVDHVVSYYQQNPTDTETLQGKKIKLDSLLEFGLVSKIDTLHQKCEVKILLLQKSFETFYIRALIAIVSIIVSLGITGFIFSYITSISITQPLERMIKKTTQIAKGNFHIRVKVGSKDELGELAKSFNKMTASLEKYEEKMRRYSKELERKVRERTRELDKKVQELEKTKVALMNLAEDLEKTNKKLREAQRKLKKSFKELKKLDIEKDRFISIAAHELKTPLTALHGFSQLLQDERIARNPEKRKKFLKIIEEETMRLGNLVTNVLELSRFDLGTLKITIEEVNIPELLNSVKEQMVENAKEKGLKLKVEIDEKLPKIKTDKEKLREILINLVHNSIKFTEKGGIKIGCKKVGDYVEFSVADTGLGIPKKSQSKIFTRFFQVESPYTRKTKGSGLGLSVCKALVEVLGGKIWFKSKVGKGTTFYFTIPIKPKKRRSK